MSVSQHDLDAFQKCFLDFARQTRRRESELTTERNDLQVRRVELEQLLTTLRAQNELILTENRDMKDNFEQKEMMLQARIKELHDVLSLHQYPQQKAEVDHHPEIQELELKLEALKLKLSKAEIYYENQLSVKDGVVSS